MTRRITLAIVTDESGMKCSDECPHVEATRTDLVCNAFGASLDDDERLPACLAAEQAAREAEASAMEAGFEHAVENVGVHDNLSEWNAAGRALTAAVARIRGGKS